MRETLDVGLVLGFDHDAGERLGAGVAKDDAAVIAESGLGGGEGAGNFGERFERGLGLYFYVENELGVILETVDEGFEAALHGDKRRDFDGGEQAVAGGTVVEKNDVAGLFAAEVVAAAKHFFEDVAVADIGARERNIFGGEDAFQAEVGHGSGDDAIAFELALGFEVARDGEEDAVSVDDFAGGGDEEGAVGIAVEGYAEVRVFGEDLLLQTFKMKGAAAGVDVAAVGRSADGDDFGAQGAEEFGAEFIGGAIGAVENHAEIGEFCAGNNAAAEEVEIGGVEGSVGDERRRIFGPNTGH